MLALIWAFALPGLGVFAENTVAGRQVSPSPGDKVFDAGPVIPNAAGEIKDPSMLGAMLWWAVAVLAVSIIIYLIVNRSRYIKAEKLQSSQAKPKLIITQGGGRRPPQL